MKDVNEKSLNREKILSFLDINQNQRVNLEVFNQIDSTNSYLLKKDQEIQILSLLHYLEKSMLEANLTERMVMEAKNEEKILLNKLAKIRGELKEITEKVEKTPNSNSMIKN